MKRSFIRGYLAALTDPAMAPMALRVALVVGSILFVINHGAALTQGKMTRVRWFSALITYGVPYAVNIHGQYVMRADSGK
jgi:hypothetical protein